MTIPSVTIEKKPEFILIIKFERHKKSFRKKLTRDDYKTVKHSDTISDY